MKQTITLIACIALILGIVVWAGPTVSDSTDPMAAYPEPYAQDGINPFVGKWINFDPNTSEITRLAIGIEYGKVMVGIWGACDPEDCFWGWMAADVPWCETQRIQLTVITPYFNEFQEIIYMPYDDYLIMRSKTFDTSDQSGFCYTSTQYFVRGEFYLPL